MNSHLFILFLLSWSNCLISGLATTTCSSNCLLCDNGTCLKCINGYWGGLCQNTCVCHQMCDINNGHCITQLKNTDVKHWHEFDIFPYVLLISLGTLLIFILKRVSKH